MVQRQVQVVHRNHLASEGLTVHSPEPGPPAQHGTEWDAGYGTSLTREQMIVRGAYGFLSRAYEWVIPVDKVVMLLPDPACEDWGAYRHGDERQPIEVRYSQAEDTFLLFTGNRRLREAIDRGEARICAFVEVEAGQFDAARRLASEGYDQQDWEEPA